MTAQERAYLAGLLNLAAQQLDATAAELKAKAKSRPTYKEDLLFADLADTTRTMRMMALKLS